MHSLFDSWKRPGIFLVFCALLSGCAVDLGNYSQTQSLETAIQTVLANQGYYQGPIDGAVGPATSRAIRNYQRDNRLTPTGTINPALVASMGLAGRQTVSVGSASYFQSYPYYAAPAYYAPPAVIGIGWGGGWPAGGYGGCWNRGWGGYRGWGGGYSRGWCR